MSTDLFDIHVMLKVAQLGGNHTSTRPSKISRIDMRLSCLSARLQLVFVRCRKNRWLFSPKRCLMPPILVLELFMA